MLKLRCLTIAFLILFAASSCKSGTQVATLDVPSECSGQIINGICQNPTSCPGNQIPNVNGVCSCPIVGQTPDSSGQCKCPSGQVASGSQCVISCPDGQAAVGGSCQLDCTNAANVANASCRSNCFNNNSLSYCSVGMCNGYMAADKSSGTLMPKWCYTKFCGSNYSNTGDAKFCNYVTEPLISNCTGSSCPVPPASSLNSMQTKIVNNFFGNGVTANIGNPAVQSYVQANLNAIPTNYIINGVYNDSGLAFARSTPISTNNGQLLNGSGVNTAIIGTGVATLNDGTTTDNIIRLQCFYPNSSCTAVNMANLSGGSDNAVLNGVGSAVTQANSGHYDVYFSYTFHFPGGNITTGNDSKGIACEPSSPCLANTFYERRSTPYAYLIGGTNGTDSNGIASISLGGLDTSSVAPGVTLYSYNIFDLYKYSQNTTTPTDGYEDDNSISSAFIDAADKKVSAIMYDGDQFRSVEQITSGDTTYPGTQTNNGQAITINDKANTAYIVNVGESIKKYLSNPSNIVVAPLAINLMTDAATNPATFGNMTPSLYNNVSLIAGNGGGTINVSLPLVSGAAQGIAPSDHSIVGTYPNSYYYYLKYNNAGNIQDLVDRFLVVGGLMDDRTMFNLSYRCGTLASNCFFVPTIDVAKLIKPQASAGPTVNGSAISNLSGPSTEIQYAGYTGNVNTGQITSSTPSLTVNPNKQAAAYATGLVALLMQAYNPQVVSYSASYLVNAMRLSSEPLYGSNVSNGTPSNSNPIVVQNTPLQRTLSSITAGNSVVTLNNDQGTKQYLTYTYTPSSTGTSTTVIVDNNNGVVSAYPCENNTCNGAMLSTLTPISGFNTDPTIAPTLQLVSSYKQDIEILDSNGKPIGLNYGGFLDGRIIIVGTSNRISPDGKAIQAGSPNYYQAYWECLNPDPSICNSNNNNANLNDPTKSGLFNRILSNVYGWGQIDIQELLVRDTSSTNIQILSKKSPLLSSTITLSPAFGDALTNPSSGAYKILSNYVAFSKYGLPQEFNLYSLGLVSPSSQNSIFLSNMNARNQNNKYTQFTSPNINGTTLSFGVNVNDNKNIISGSRFIDSSNLAKNLDNHFAIFDYTNKNYNNNALNGNINAININKKLFAGIDLSMASYQDSSYVSLFNQDKDVANIANNSLATYANSGNGPFSNPYLLFAGYDSVNVSKRFLDGKLGFRSSIVDSSNSLNFSNMNSVSTLQPRNGNNAFETEVMYKTDNSSLYSLSFGRLDESNNLLDSSTYGGFSFAQGAKTNYYTLKFFQNVYKDLYFVGNITEGFTNMPESPDSVFAKFSNIRSRKLSCGFSQKNFLGGTVSVFYTQPLRLISGKATVNQPASITNDGYIIERTDVVNITPLGQERDMELVYSIASGNNSIDFNLLRRLQPGNIEYNKKEDVVLLRFGTKF